MRLVRTLAVAAVVLALGMVPATGAVAQMIAPLVHLGAAGGVSVPLGDFSKTYQVGYLVGGLIEGAPSGFPIGLRGEVSYSGHTPKGGGSTTSLLGLLGNVVINLDTPNSGLYLIGGGGMYHVNYAGAVSNNKFGVNGGGGFRWPLAGTSTFVEVRYHYISNAGSRPIINPGGTLGSAAGGSVTFIPIVFGVTF